MTVVRELRRGPRIPIRTLLVRTVQGNRLVRGDVSLYGVGFELTAPCYLRPGHKFEVQLFLPDQILRLRAIVTRILRSEPRAVGRLFVGAELIGLDELAANPLYRFVEESALLRRPLLPL